MYDNVRKPESDWYEAGYTAPRTDTAGTGCYDSYWSPSQAAAPKKKPHQGLKITMIILGVLVLIIASCYVFAGRGRDERYSRLAGRGRDSISVDGDPGQHGSVTLPREDTDDDTTVTGKNELPTAPTDPSVTMTLQPAGGSALTLQSVYAKCLPSVVGIHADISRSEYSTGTGIVLTADGYIVTNTHVLDGAKTVTVTTSDGTEYTGKLVGADAVSDIAVLKIEAQGLTPAEFGDSSSLQVGDDVVSIGNPLGEQLRWTMTNGIISAINRDMVYNGHSMTLLQTNAAINEGNSGGPLINMYGQVIGITNMKALSTGVEGIGFAIPTASIRPIVNALLADGRVSGRVSIGITVGAVSSAASEYYDLPDGLYISAVAEGSDAEKQGIQSGDMLLAVNGQAVTTTYDVSAAKDGLKVGDTVTLTIYRDGKTFDVDVKLVDTNDIS